MNVTPADLAQKIEHTLLNPEATPVQIDALCDEAAANGFLAVCVNPVYVRQAARRLEQAVANRRLCVVSAAGFPLGANLSQTKADEAARALDDGASEIDMVMALGAFLAGNLVAVRRDIEAVAEVVHRTKGGVLKLILETAALTTEQIILGCRCAAEGEADFVKTSTGFHPAGGATVEHVRLLHRYASPMPVKAAGGIRTALAAQAMIQAGAARIGTSHGVAIMEELRRTAASRL